MLDLIGMLSPFVLLAVAAGLSIEFGEKQMSVLDRCQGVRLPWNRDYPGIG